MREIERSSIFIIVGSPNSGIYWGMVIGLTGGMGSGKSTVSRMFAKRGFKCIDCDEIVHRLLASDSQVGADIRESFGADVFLDDGSIDRKALGSIVFKDDVRLKELEEILHPRVRETWEGEVRREPDADWLIEIPLLFEKNLQNRVDFTVCVLTDLSTQVERLEQKGMDQAQALARINRQMPISQKAENADCVLLNEGSLEFLEDQVNRTLLTLR